MTRFLLAGQCATALALVLSAPALAQTVAEQAEQCTSDVYTVECTNNTVLDRLVVRAASEELKQALGVSNITAQDLERRPVGRDLSEIVRTMPGVNLTGNTSGGQYGQSRQIDLRGMGPENTLILIDGKPVLSRNSTRMGRHGERDTRGDSNWVPPELIERIEVIRGPAAARYGSGAAGGVVNIITKRPDHTTMTVSTYMLVPESSDEGGTQRANITVGGPINDIFSYRLTAGGSWTQPDAIDINAEAAAEEGATSVRAGREGVTEYDVRGLWSAQVNPDHRLDLEAAWSIQSNQFVGGQPSGVVDPDGTSLIDQLAQANAETSSLQRTTLSLTHFGTYDFGESNSYIQWERTRNKRLSESNNGGGEAQFNSDSEYSTSILDNITAKSEWDIPLSVIWEQTATLGAEYRGEFLEAPITLGDEQNHMETHLLGLYLEDNIQVTDQFTLTPGIRLDAHSSFGTNWSPSLNASYALTDEITVKAGIARAFKAPNLYQLSPDYTYGSRGNGCPFWYPGSCSIRGNPDLQPEISINKEIGVSYANLDGWAASLLYYHNDYENKITSSETYTGDSDTGQHLFNWENGGPAVISGIEGSLTVPLHETVSWTTNFTKVVESKRKVWALLDDGVSQGWLDVPVSLVPEYTINSSIRWEAMENLGLTLSATYYGPIEASTRDFRGREIAEENRTSRDPYGTVSLGLDYQVNDNLKLAAGVNNLLNTRQFATAGSTSTGSASTSGSSNANTFNEPGRSYYVSLTGSF